MDECYFCLKDNSTRIQKNNICLYLGKLIKGGCYIMTVLADFSELDSKRSTSFKVNYCPMCGRKL